MSILLSPGSLKSILVSTLLAVLFTGLMLFLNWVIVPFIVSFLTHSFSSPALTSETSDLQSALDILLSATGTFAFMVVALRRGFPHGVAVASFTAFIGWWVYFNEAGYFQGMVNSIYPWWYEGISFISFPLMLGIAIFTMRSRKVYIAASQRQSPQTARQPSGLSLNLSESVTRTLPQFKILVGLVALDVLSKIIAYALLPSDAFVMPEALFQFVLRLNFSGISGRMQMMLADPQTHDSVISVPVFSFGLGLLLLYLAFYRKLTVRRVAFSIVLMAFMANVGVRIFPDLDRVIQHHTILVLSGCFFWSVVWILSTGRFWKLGALLLLSCGIGNFLSTIYPPYYVVDFLWSEPLNRILKMGIFNLADAMILMAYPVFIFAALRSIFIKLKNSKISRYAKAEH